MFLDREMTPELVKEIQRQQVIIAYGRHEAFEKGKALKAEGEFGFPGDAAASQLDYIIRRWRGFNASWTELSGKRVLDLAAGSAASRDPWGVWYPHFSRLCAVNGADVVAIDIKSQYGLDRTMFDSAEADLVEVVVNQGLQSLPILQGREFDIINSTSFVGENCSPDLGRQLVYRNIEYQQFEEMLLTQAGALLAEGGVMTLDTRDAHFLPILYTKKESKIIELT